ncbi:MULTISPECIES: hypothetical protein [unclassified Pseudonocardia]|uniref:hypothetical protein n=1 Tax=unclassified Pseudonocardia TaxID=2619320 RepID=UPI0011AEAB46|nr:MULTISPECIES: hypothetical protein [unclassified Pseudonocardia]
MYDIEYPSASDPADGPLAFGNLAESADAALLFIEGGGVPESSGKGIVGLRRQSTPTGYGSTVIEIGSLTFVANLGRRYRVNISGVLETNGAGNARASVYLYAGYGASQPTTLRMNSAFDMPAPSFSVTANVSDTISITSGGVYTVRTAFSRGYTHPGLVRARDFVLTVEDVGAS